MLLAFSYHLYLYTYWVLVSLLISYRKYQLKLIDIVGINRGLLIFDRFFMKECFCNVISFNFLPL